MDPFTALGVACNIVQFVDYGATLTSSVLELYRSADGALSANLELETIITDLAQVTTNVMKSTSSREVTSDEFALQKVALSCKRLAEDILAVLRGLKVQSRHQKWKSFRQAVKSVWKEREIQDYVRRLQAIQSELGIHMIATLRNQQSNIQNGIVKLSTRLGQLEMSSPNRLVDAKDELLATVHTIGSTLDVQTLSDVVTRNLAMLEERSTLEKELKILESLRFPGMETRHSRVIDAHARTFQWIFEDASADRQTGVYFNDWLQHSNDIYWVSGKAGSGKSTLMKYLSDHQRSITALESWAGGKKLIVASFFFWSAGTDIGKSQEGLLQSLLYNIVRQNPALIPDICSSRWNNPHLHTESWYIQELEQAFVRLRERALASAKYCFFIDGLDEYDGDHAKIIEVIRNLALSADIKLCVSSRPWNIFDEAFGDDYQRMLKLHDLTRKDIELYIQDNLEEDARFVKLKSKDTRYQDLVSEIGERAQGVFLWVFLVVRDLLRGLTNYDKISDLQRRLRSLPTDLEKYFRKMLDTVEPIYQKEAARIYQIRSATPGCLFLLMLAYIDSEDASFGVYAPVKAWNESDISEKHREVQRRIQARCRDLLHISHTPGTVEQCSISRYIVEYLHRTVSEFLESKEIQEIIHERASNHLDPDVYICNAVVAIIKLMSQSEIYMSPFVSVTIALNNFLYHALQAEGNGSHLSISLYDELDSTIRHHRKLPVAADLAKFASQSPSSWYRFGLESGYYKEWFLILATQEGLLCYLKSRLDQEPSLVNDTHGHSLLHYAVDRFTVRQSTDEVRPRPKIIRLLFEKGARPNDLVETHTAWQIFLLSIENGDACLRTRSIWAEIIELFLTYGADPEALCDISYRGEQILISASRIIAHVCLAPDLRRLRPLMERRIGHEIHWSKIKQQKWQSRSPRGNARNVSRHVDDKYFSSSDDEEEPLAGENLEHRTKKNAKLEKNETIAETWLTERLEGCFYKNQTESNKPDTLARFK